jgi:hypothetical protein
LKGDAFLLKEMLQIQHSRVTVHDHFVLYTCEQARGRSTRLVMLDTVGGSKLNLESAESFFQSGSAENFSQSASSDGISGKLSI